jgi:CubicO group peptidase (beta-lactamase class C family)
MEATCVIGPGSRVHFSGEAGLVPWWSFTKTVLATTALRLVETGALALDEPVGGERYTLRHLLRHEAGLPDYGGLQKYQNAVAGGQEPWIVEELLRLAGGARLIFEPGDGWAYSNIGYLKVGQIVASVAGEPLDAAVRRLVLIPAGAASARFAFTREDLRDVKMGDAAGYHPGWVYHGLLVGQLLDAARVLHRLLVGDLLGGAMLAEMRDARVLPQWRSPIWLEPAYGLGLMTPAVPGGRRVLGHSGEGPGSTIAVYGVEGIHGPSVAGAWSSRDAPVSVEAAALELLDGEQV